MDKVVTGATLLTKPTFFSVLTNHKSHPFGNEICYIWPLGPWQLRLQAAPAATAAAHTRHLFSPGARVFAAAFLCSCPIVDSHSPPTLGRRWWQQRRQQDQRAPSVSEDLPYCLPPSATAATLPAPPTLLQRRRRTWQRRRSACVLQWRCP